MLTIELDNDTELALKELANQQGKTLEQWAKETLSTFTTPHAWDDSETSHAQSFPDLSKFHNTLPMQQISAGEFCRAMRDEDRY